MPSDLPPARPGRRTPVPAPAVLEARIAGARQGIARLEAIRDKARHGTAWSGDDPGTAPGIPVPRGVAAARQVVANCDRELAVYARKLAAARGALEALEVLGRRPPPDGEDLHR